MFQFLKKTPHPIVIVEQNNFPSPLPQSILEAEILSRLSDSDLLSFSRVCRSAYTLTRRFLPRYRLQLENYQEKDAAKLYHLVDELYHPGTRRTKAKKGLLEMLLSRTDSDWPAWKNLRKKTWFLLWNVSGLPKTERETLYYEFTQICENEPSRSSNAVAEMVSKDAPRASLRDPDLVKEYSQVLRAAFYDGYSSSGGISAQVVFNLMHSELSQFEVIKLIRVITETMKIGKLPSTNTEIVNRSVEFDFVFRAILPQIWAWFSEQGVEPTFYIIRSLADFGCCFTDLQHMGLVADFFFLTTEPSTRFIGVYAFWITFISEHLKSSTPFEQAISILVRPSEKIADIGAFVRQAAKFLPKIEKVLQKYQPKSPIGSLDPENGL